jgi:hypothetical protein
MSEATTILLQRNTAGFEVEIHWLPTTEIVVLQTRIGGESAAVTIKPDRIKDAFDHPALYLNEAQVDLLFSRAAD